MTATRCRAQGGPAACTKANCPARRAAAANGFSGPALGGFGDPTGFPFYDLTETPRFHQTVAAAVGEAVSRFDDWDRADEALGFAVDAVRGAYPEGSQALHMMNHNTGILAVNVQWALEHEYEARGIGE